MDQGRVHYIYLFGVLYSNACTKQRFMTSMACETLQTWFDFDQDIIDAATE